MGLKPPLLIFDGQCGFCRYWVDRWGHGNTEIQVIPSQEIFAQVDGEREEDWIARVRKFDLTQTVVWVNGEKEIFSGAGAIFQFWAFTGRRAWTLKWYRMVLFRWLSEGVYAWVARHRIFLSKLMGKLGLL